MPNSGGIVGYQLFEPACSQEFYLNEKDENSYVIHGYAKNTRGEIIYILLCIFFIGIPYLICSWYPKLKVLKYQKSPLTEAEIVLVCDNHQNSVIVTVEVKYLKIPNVGHVSVRHFIFQHTKIVWNALRSEFGLLEDLIGTKPINYYLDDTTGLLETDYFDLINLYGPNKIEVEIKSYWTLFVEEVFNPFYVFQLFSVTLWFFDHYEIYAITVIILTLFSAITSLLETRKQSEALHNLVESSKCHTVQVIRQNLLGISEQLLVDSSELVPGDLIVLPAGNFILPCDAILLTGQCIVNESMLTGESVPITKTPPSHTDELYNIKLHKRHTLFAGTLLIQTRYYGGELILARVTKTGFDTAKGSLVKSILYPSPINLQFYKDSFKFILVLFFVASIGMAYCLYLYVKRKAETREVIIRTLDIITIAVPPALPAAMTVGSVYSQNRLKKLGIFCLSPPRINVCGKIKLACFDKTGTLTNDDLEIHSVIYSKNGYFDEPSLDISHFDKNNAFVHGMATCHSLTRIDGELNGDPLDLNMFQFTEWELEEPGSDENARYDMLAPTIVSPNLNDYSFTQTKESLPVPQIGIIRQFPFSSTLQCMSVITREISSMQFVAFTKGAPERVQSMCLPETVPSDFHWRLSYYTAKGFRVIAVAYKILPQKFKWKEAQKAKRDVIECNLIFLGLLIMQNPLKPATAPVIRILKQAQIRTVMITGDNIHTAVSVAHDCGMVDVDENVYLMETSNDRDPNVIPNITFEVIGSSMQNCIDIQFDHNSYHLALDGKTWEKLKTYYPDKIPSILMKATVFARFQPDQKTQLINYFQQLDYVVSMVGDGANDCGALKAAHVGVSLSQAEASVAAPFTSAIPNISCIVHLMLEGRCALVTSFAVFKYMALYSLIQFSTILILYTYHSILGDMQFLFIDLIITTSLAVTMPSQGPAHKLTVKRPLGSLVSVKNLIPMLLQVITCTLVQVAALFFLMRQSWYEPYAGHGSDEIVTCWENTVLFTVSCFQYIILATVYSKGKPYRKRLITNILFLLSALLLTCFTTWLLIAPSKKLAEFFEIMYLPKEAHEQDKFRYILLIFPILHFAIATFIEIAIADNGWIRKITHFLKLKNRPKNRYKHLQENNELIGWIREINTDNYNNSVR